MNRGSRRQWLGFALALFIILLLYRSLNKSHAQSTITENIDYADGPAPIPDVPTPDLFENPDFPVEHTDTPSHESFWSRLPIRHPAAHAFPRVPTRSRSDKPQIQSDESNFSQILTWFQKSRQAAVKEAFTRCWDSYKSLAWQTDELAPMSGSPNNGLGGWGLTLVDNLDTLWIMDMRAEFKEAVATVVETNFEDTQSSEINTHEINIRILGGLLSAYDLSVDRRLLNKAIEVGDMLYAAFDTPNRMPITHWDLHRAARQEEQFAEEVVSASELGSFILEFTRLSQLTGNPKYFNSAHTVMDRLGQLQDLTKLAGMWPVVLNARTEIFDSELFTLGAEVDSLYKTLAKADMLTGGQFPVYRKMYERSTLTAAGHSLFRPMTPHEKDILVPGSIRVMMTQNGKPRTQLEGQVHHRACFTGGMFALGSALFRIPTHLKIANKLVDGCTWAAQSMPLGIMPEVYETVPCASQNECPWNEWYWKQEIWKNVNASPEPDPDMNIDTYIHEHHLPKGIISIPDTRYNLRPEIIESMLTLYRVSAREDLLDTAWEMFESIQNTTEIINGNAALADVTLLTEEPIHLDSMESFWMSQTLKYFYLMFSAPDALSLDEYVFNSAGHPLRLPEPEWSL
ncbi:hypothetical protein N7466_007666 [Penicillium verhagenii]|uniref:uncharacterized protein n=1 Tax=Penicillium verhagenii TaxID=1562060 RepID=UPI002544EC14|nr:uncharacterized protein N7466_007666 [Penicillium verhagenii]KAJ5928710.1 hypothetical protein N7466_007666 [Penicillium verhagenii]